MKLSKEARQKLINCFKTEQIQHVKKINEGLLALEKCPMGNERQALLNEVFREAHSLKGAAQAVGMTIMQNLGLSLEDLLLNAREGHLIFSPELFDLFYQALDAVELLVARVEAGEPTPSAKVLALMVQLEDMREAIAQAKEQGNRYTFTGAKKTGAEV
jgi:two-component system chemotaxis sensor kinase CheA